MVICLGLHSLCNLPWFNAGGTRVCSIKKDFHLQSTLKLTKLTLSLSLLDEIFFSNSLLILASIWASNFFLSEQKSWHGELLTFSFPWAAEIIGTWKPETDDISAAICSLKDSTMYIHMYYYTTRKKGIQVKECYRRSPFLLVQMRIGCQNAFPIPFIHI